MRYSLLPALLLCACAATPRPATVPVLAQCEGMTLHSHALVTGPAQVQTVAHAVRCPGGERATRIQAGGLDVGVLSDDGYRVSLGTWGEPWAGAAVRVRRLEHGDSGRPLFTESGQVVCLVEMAVAGEYVRCVPPDGTSVQVEAPRWGLTSGDLEAPPGEWP